MIAREMKNDKTVHYLHEEEMCMRTTANVKTVKIRPTAISLSFCHCLCHFIHYSEKEVEILIEQLKNIKVKIDADDWVNVLTIASAVVAVAYIITTISIILRVNSDQLPDYLFLIYPHVSFIKYFLSFSATSTIQYWLDFIIHLILFDFLEQQHENPAQRAHERQRQQ